MLPKALRKSFFWVTLARHGTRMDRAVETMRLCACECPGKNIISLRPTWVSRAPAVLRRPIWAYFPRRPKISRRDCNRARRFQPPAKKHSVQQNRESELLTRDAAGEPWAHVYRMPFAQFTSSCLHLVAFFGQLHSHRGTRGLPFPIRDALRAVTCPTTLRLAYVQDIAIGSNSRAKDAHRLIAGAGE